MMGTLTVGVGDYKISKNLDDKVKTYALGSCVAIIVYDRVNKIAGLMHIALPDSSVSPEKGKILPGYFADTGIPILIEEFKKLGTSRKGIWIKLVGGARVADPKSIFDIGKRNILAIKKILWSKNLGPIAEDVGGNFSRTVTVDVETGEVLITSGQKKWNL
jgi:chemotaxis protein CheD